MLRATRGRSPCGDRSDSIHCGNLDSRWSGDDITQVRPYEMKGDELSWKVAPRPDGSVPITILRRAGKRVFVSRGGKT